MLVFVASIINAFTEHYSKRKPGWFKGLMAAIERMSVLTSKDVEGKFKAPLQSKKPLDEIDRRVREALGR